MRVDAGRGQADHRHPGVPQEGRLYHLSINMSVTAPVTQRVSHTLLRPPGPPVLTRLRLLMTSVLSEIGRGRPCSFRNRPQALQSTAPVSSRRHSGVVLVVQFWQTG